MLSGFVQQSVPEFRLALTAFMEEAGLLQSSEDEESGENLRPRHGQSAPDRSRVLHWTVVCVAEFW
jgi:hypothetical protein